MVCYSLKKNPDFQYTTNFEFYIYHLNPFHFSPVVPCVRQQLLIYWSSCFEKIKVIGGFYSLGNIKLTVIYFQFSVRIVSIYNFVIRCATIFIKSIYHYLKSSYITRIDIFSPKVFL